MAKTLYERDMEDSLRQIAVAIGVDVSSTTDVEDVIRAAGKAGKDADRYRYLRNRIPAEVLGQVKSSAGCWIDGEDEEGTLVLLTGDDADVAVDAAMLAARGIGAA